MEAAGRVLDSRTSIRVSLSPDDEVVITTTVEQHITVGERTTPAKVSVLRSRIRGVYASETPEAVRDLLVMSRLCPYFSIGSWVVGVAEKTVVSDEVRQPWTVGEAMALTEAMEASRLASDRVRQAVREGRAAGRSIADLAREVGVTRQTIYRWLDEDASPQS